MVGGAIRRALAVKVYQEPGKHHGKTDVHNTTGFSSKTALIPQKLTRPASWHRLVGVNRSGAVT
jgi:hypothetical protein